LNNKLLISIFNHENRGQTKTDNYVILLPYYYLKININIFLALSRPFPYFLPHPVFYEIKKNETLHLTKFKTELFIF